jgi:hypothetical protein
MKPAYLILMFFLAPFARAEFYRGPITKSLAGSGRAGLPGMESAFLNPALIPLVKASEMSVFYNDGYTGPSELRNGWGLGIIDAHKEVYFPGALHYVRTRETGRASGAVDGELWHMAVGKNISDRLAVGGSLYRLTHDVEGDSEYEQWNGALGFLILISENMGVAYVLDNPAKPAGRTPIGLREDMQHHIGFYGTIAQAIKVRADIGRQEKFNPDHKLNYALGVESMTSKWLLFRAGFRRDELADRRLWAAGLGFNGPRLRVNYAFEKNPEGTGGAAHSVDLIVPF